MDFPGQRMWTLSRLRRGKQKEGKYATHADNIDASQQELWIPEPRPEEPGRVGAGKVVDEWYVCNKAWTKGTGNQPEHRAFDTADWKRLLSQEQRKGKMRRIIAMGLGSPSESANKAYIGSLRQHRLVLEIAKVMWELAKAEVAPG